MTTRTAATPAVYNVHQRESDKPWTNFAEYLLAVRDKHGGGLADPRLNRAIPTGMGIGNDSDGGFMVPDEFGPGIQETAFAGGTMLGGVHPVTMTSSTYHMNLVDETSRANGSRWGGIRSYRVGENQTATASRPKVRRGTLDVSNKKLAIITYATEEQLADGPATSDILLQGYSEELTFGIEREILHGLGGAECSGVMTSPALITVTKDVGQTAATVTATNLAKMNARLSPRSHGRARWYVNAAVSSQLPFMTLMSPCAWPEDGDAGGAIGVLFGKPVFVHEACKPLGTLGDIVLMDPGCYAVGSRGAPSFKLSGHVRFVEGEGVFRSVWRVDGLPLWAGQLTPFEGSDTVSPYVTLETRA